MYGPPYKSARQKMMEECKEFIDRVRKTRHKKTLQRQTAKYERLCQKNRAGCLNHGHSKSNHPKDINTMEQDTITIPTMTTTN